MNKLIKNCRGGQEWHFWDKLSQKQAGTPKIQFWDKLFQKFSHRLCENWCRGFPGAITSN